MESENKELVDPNEVMNSEAYRELEQAFHDNVDIGAELQISRVAIMQPQSPEVTNQEPGYRAGQLADNLTREVLSHFIKQPWLKGKVPDDELGDVNVMAVVPIFKLPTEFIKWKDLKTEGRGFHFKTLDPRDPRVREGVWPPRGTWGNKPGQEGAPPVTENMNFLCVVLNPTETPFEVQVTFIVVTFSRTSATAGKRFLQHILQNKMNKLPFWGRVFYIWTKKETNEAGVFYVMKIAKGPRTQDVAPHILDECFMMAKRLSESREFQETMINAAHLEVAGEGEEEEFADDAFSDTSDDVEF